MRAKNAFLVFFGLLFVYSVSLAWTNPSGSPPSGGGAIQVDVSGNVGVGTASPLQKFHVEGGDVQLNNNRFVRFRNAAGNGDGAFILTDGNDLEWRDPASGSMTFTILDGGSVGIGVSPTEKLDVKDGEIRFGYNGNLGGLESEGNAPALSTFLYYNWHYNNGQFRRDTASRPSARLSIGEGGLSLDYASAGTGQILSPTNLLTITSGGNVGIGSVTTPAQKLVVAGDINVTGGRYLLNGSNFTGVPAGTSGAIQFNNSGAFGGDAANLSWDNTNKRLGIGTATPAAGAKLDVVGRLVITGASDPGGNLHFTAATPVVSSTGRVYFPGGIHVLSTGNIFADAMLFADGGVQDFGGPLILNDDVQVTGGGLGVGGAPAQLLDVYGNARVSSRVAATDAFLEIGAGGSGNRSAYIDLVGDNTYTDYGLRLTRNNTGANSESGIYHRGTGPLILRTDDNNGEIVFQTNSGAGVTERMIIRSSGNVGIGTNSASSTLQIHNPNEDIVKTNFTQGLARAGLIISTDYAANAYTPGIFWSTENDNATRPKAGIYLQETAVGTKMILGISDDYTTGITKEVIITDDGEIQTLNSNSVKKIWGEGRPGVATYDSTGTLDNNTGECNNSGGTLRIGRGNTSVDWGNSAAGCPAGWWVCTVAELNNKNDPAKGPAGDCASHNKHYRSCSNTDGSPSPELGETDLAWAADRGFDGPNVNGSDVDDGTYYGSAVKRSNNNRSTDIPLCNQMPVWCCKYN